MQYNIFQVEKESDLEYLLKNSPNKLIVVNFSASWCGPCQKMKPYFISFSKKYSDILFLTIDIEKYVDVKFKFIASIKELPTYLAYYNSVQIKDFAITGFYPNKLDANIQTFFKSINKSFDNTVNIHIPTFKLSDTLPEKSVPKKDQSEDVHGVFAPLEQVYSNFLK